MAQENVEIVRRFFEAIRQGDNAAALACLAPDVEYQVGQELPMRGRDAVWAMWERWESDWEELETVTEEFLDAGEHVVVTVRCAARGRGSGVEVDNRTFDVFTLRDGKCVRKLEFQVRSEALAAVGLSE
jgi:ketosteroid isomerase-like protein